MIKPFEPKTLRAALKEIERQRAINLKYADLFEKREKELKEENANLSERLYAEQSDVLESDQKLNTIYHIIDSIQKELDKDKQSDSQLKGVFGAEWIQLRVNKIRETLNVPISTSPKSQLSKDNLSDCGSDNKEK